MTASGLPHQMPSPVRDAAGDRRNRTAPGHSRRALLILDAGVDQYPPTLNTVAILAESGFEVDIVAAQDGAARHDFPVGVRMHAVSDRMRGAGRIAQLARAAIRLAHQRRPGVIVGYDARGICVAGATRAALWRAGKRLPMLVYHNHDALVWEDFPGIRRLGRRLEGLLARSADLVIVPDAHRAAWFARYHRLPQLPTTVWNCPRLRTPRRSETLRSALVARGVSFARVVLRQQGRLGPGHGIETAIRSVPLWQPGTGLVLLGEPSAAYETHLRRLAEELGVGDRVVLLPRVPYERVLDFTCGADVGLATYENMGINRLYNAGASNKLFEYAAAGVPVVASRLPGFVEIVEGNGIGRCVDPLSPDETASAVNALLQEPLASACGAAAAAMHATVWNYEQQFAPVLDSFRTALEVIERED